MKAMGVSPAQYTGRSGGVMTKFMPPQDQRNDRIMMQPREEG